MAMYLRDAGLDPADVIAANQGVRPTKGAGKGGGGGAPPSAGKSTDEMIKRIMDTVPQG
jgi:hypothetical protein